MAVALSWPSTGGKDASRRRTVDLVSLAAALSAHLGFCLVQANHEEIPAASRALEASWVQLEEEAASTPEPPPPSEPAAPSERTLSQNQVPIRDPNPAAGSPSEAPGAGEGESDGASEDAAPLLTAEGSSADWALLSGTGTGLSGRRRGAGGSSEGFGRALTLSARDLSRDAIAPDLRPWVEQNFPGHARMSGVSGTATISAFIDPSGVPSDVRVEAVDPSGRGFGEACTRTLHQGPRWKPKLNRDGRPLSARVTYTCVFKNPTAHQSPSATAGASGAAANRIWRESPE